MLTCSLVLGTINDVPLCRIHREGNFRCTFVTYRLLNKCILCGIRIFCLLDAFLWNGTVCSAIPNLKKAILMCPKGHTFGFPSVNGGVWYNGNFLHRANGSIKHNVKGVYLWRENPTKMTLSDVFHLGIPCASLPFVLLLAASVTRYQIGQLYVLQVNKAPWTPFFFFPCFLESMGICVTHTGTRTSCMKLHGLSHTDSYHSFSWWLGRLLSFSYNEEDDGSAYWLYTSDLSPYIGEHRGEDIILSSQQAEMVLALVDYTMFLKLWTPWM